MLVHQCVTGMQHFFNLLALWNVFELKLQSDFIEYILGISYEITLSFEYHRTSVVIGQHWFV